MFDWLTRLLRRLWRQEAEGATGRAEEVPSPPETKPHEEPAAPPVALVWQAPPAPLGVASDVRSPRDFAAQFQSVARLNQPSSRARSKPILARTMKPKPVACVPQPKRVPEMRSGAVLSRIDRTNRTRSGADIVDFAAVRRAKVEQFDCLTAALGDPESAAQTYAALRTRSTRH
jgi:hypothetical protein